jgi:hypothetical protein
MLPTYDHRPARFLRVFPLTALLLVLAGVLASPALAAESSPAGGAAISEIVTATTAAMLITGALFALGWAHRAGRITVLQRVADHVGRVSGMPSWVALPVELAAVSLIGAVFGMYWDISLHIDDGRDPGPLANPAHYFILAGLFGIFAAGFLAIVLPKDRPSRSSVRITRNWWAPVGGLVLLSCSALSLIGFPLDDVWHRLFGQDVTLWGPTHLMLLTGAGFSLIGIAMLLVEGIREREKDPAPEVPRMPERLKAYVMPIVNWVQRSRYAFVCGGLLIGLSVYQAEYDFGVPQFRLVFHPVMLAFASGLALVAARIYVGRGGALIAAGFFILVRGGLALIVGGVFGETTPTFPLYLVEAFAVEGVALMLIPRARPYAFGAASGFLVGTVGFAAEWAYSQAVFPNPWPARVLGEGALLVPVTGVGAGLLGAFLGCALTAPRFPSEVRVPALGPVIAGFLAIVAVTGYGLATQPQRRVTAQVTLTQTSPAPDRHVDATIRVTPAGAAKDADWVEILGWQGKQRLHIDHLKQVGDGTWRTTKPAPVYGTWKTIVRVHKGDSLISAPVYMPEDTAIPARGVAATAHFQRPFILDKKVLQREQKAGISPSLWTVAYGIVGLCVLALLIILTWALTRSGTAGAPPKPTSGTRTTPGRVAAGSAS